MLDFAQQEGEKGGGRTWLVLVAGESPENGPGTWRRAAAVAHSVFEILPAPQSSVVATRGVREREREREDGRSEHAAS